VNVKVLRALGHPLRVMVLDELARQTASPVQLARTWGIGLSKLSYHVTVLKNADLIEEVETRPAGGSTEHFYRASIRDPLRWLPAVLDPKGQREVDEAIEKSTSAIQLAHKRSAQRLSKAGATSSPVTVVFASLEMPALTTSEEH
jgi:DNA-binding transcriptional ArsR family regulator